MSIRKFWTPEEDEVILSNYGKLSYREISCLLDRTPTSVERRTVRLADRIPNKITLEKERVLWTPEEDQIIIDNFGKLTYTEMMKLLPNRSRVSICKRQKRLEQRLFNDKKAYYGYDFWTEEEEAFIKDHYYVMELKDIASYLKRTEVSIRHRAKENLGLDFDKRHIRDFNINKDFFNTPNIINSWVAGFIAADGCLSERKYGFSIGLQLKDGYILEIIKDLVEYGGKIKYFPKRNKAVLHTSGVPEWFRDLDKHFSITPRKSLTLKPPKILNEECIKAFIRGYIDGDGMIKFVGRNPFDFCLRITGTEELLDWINDNFIKWGIREIYGNGREPQVNSFNNENVSRLTLSGKKALHILKLLITVDVPGLERKWSPVLNFINS
jgi:hypothetical protein